jgi:enediyne biosynthesis protein E4
LALLFVFHMNRSPLHFLILAVLGAAILSCNGKKNTLFKLLSPDQTGIRFNNQIIEQDTFNILTHEYIYNGGGVGVADFNNDGLQDIFFTGNQVSSKLFLNKGGMQFRDISEDAGVQTEGRWSSGVAIADINNDGWNDMYVCATMHPDSANRKNMLFINNGLNENGIPTFTDRAAEYKLEHGGYSVTAAFLDYDKDNDLDLYLLINQRMDNIPSTYRPKIIDGSALNNDRLFRNENNGTFTDVTMEAGITIEGFGLGLSISDLNLDGWPDIYVSNDYLSNDILYINNGDGTFTDRIAEFIGHQSRFSMGNDAADFNNDGLPDIITTDMLPETNYRKKTTIGNKSYLTHINNVKYGYEPQYVRNMLHLNNGLKQEIRFSEIGQLSGIHQTEWSWSPLFADFDNDGHKDLIVTNGFPKDITDKDFANYRSVVGNVASMAMLNDSIPVVEIPNYVFRNNGDLTFKDMTAEWGFNHPSFSNGASFADLDNDGDLDYVVNNINSEAAVYENTLYDAGKNTDKQNNFIRLQLFDPSGVKSPIGATAKLYSNGSVQYYENSIYRGFLSSVENFIHFGLGANETVDSIVVRWSDDNVQKLVKPAVNALISIPYEKGSSSVLTSITNKESARLFQNHTLQSGIAFKHAEEDKIDFNVQRTLPHKFTQAGPGMAVGDLNNDGLQDLVAGGSTGYGFSVFIQKPDGTFKNQPGANDVAKIQEDAGMLLFDADGDDDLDLYVVSGSMEHFDSKDAYQDRLYFNDGKGVFTLDINALPDTQASGSCVRAADFDSDGDLDLFVGGRLIPAQYPASPESYLLRNDNGNFIDVTTEVSTGLQDAGMVTDAIWTDFNGDNQIDLIVVGEFTPVMFFQNTDGLFSRITTAIDNQAGWWNSITASDYDLDGDVDYVIGNLGLNNCYQVTPEFPLKIYADDFDGNGSMDAIMACYMRESMDSDVKRLYPVHFWDELNTQSPKFRNKFSRYRQFGRATMDILLDDQERNDALVLEAGQMASVFVENLGGGKFEISLLPALAQVAPLNGMLTDDVNQDGFPDVIMVGNDYGNEVFAGRYDAFNGLVLLGDGKGNFEAKSAAESGFYVPGDAKSLVKLAGVRNELFIAGQNRDSLRVFLKTNTAESARFIPAPLDEKAELVFEDGKKQTVEFYYGSGYLSQSSRSISIPSGVREMTVYNSRGESRKAAIPASQPQPALMPPHN